MFVFRQGVTAISQFIRDARCATKAFPNDRSGNFGLVFGLTAIPIMIGLGCSFDYVQALNTNHRMQAALDAALVAAVKDVGTDDETAIKSRMTKWLNAETVQSGTYVLNADSVQIDKTNSTITAVVAATVPTSFLKIAHIDTIPVSVKSSIVGGATTTKSAFSMYLVLDRSGSMKDATTTSYTTTCNGSSCTKIYTKIEALKLAVSSLTTQLSTSDPNDKYVRLAAVSYNGSMQTPSPLDWSKSVVQSYVNALTPTSTTDSSDAMATAYAALVDKTTNKDEDKIHYAKNGVSSPRKYIIFMTDGENTMPNNSKQVNAAADASTLATCDAARTAGVIVYTIAFMAPEHGQDLLRSCATTPAYYFSAESTADIVNAFTSIGETSSQNKVRLTQ